MLSQRTPKLLTVLLLILLNLAIFWQVQTFDFVEYDDTVYVRDNVNVLGGVDGEAIKWAFQSTNLGFWHPLTWVSLMIDNQFFGMNPGGYHWTNVLLHLVAGLFLFLALSRMTGSVWKSGFVAALFAIHPLHVESVAWVAERKDVLSGVFWMLTLWLYAFYVEKPNPLRYLWVFSAFVFGLMAKPMLVTLPFVLLLADIWPLRRFSLTSPYESTDLTGASLSPQTRKSSLLFLICEKIPLFIMTGLASWLVVYTEKKMGALAPLSAIPFMDRLCNAAISYLAYIVKTFCPTDLSAFYPYSSNYNFMEVSLAVILLLWITILALVLIKKAPYIAVGWFWFLGTLVPVIGLVQVGSHAMADRYTYIPLVGLFITLTWGMADLMKGIRRKKAILTFTGFLVLLILAILTNEQLGKWRNTETLFRHALAATGSGNYVAHNGLGIVMFNRGKKEEALFHFRSAIKSRPNYEPAINNAGLALQSMGKKKEAMNYFRTAILVEPNHATAYFNLGLALRDENDLTGAETEFRKAIRINSQERDYYYWLATVLLRQDRVAEARGNYEICLRVQKGPIQVARDMKNPEAQTLEKAMVSYFMGLVCVEMGRYSLAIDQYREAIAFQPKLAFLYNNLGVALTEKECFADAAGAYREAIRLDPKHAGAHNNLGMVLFKTGQIDEAGVRFREAIRLQPDFANAHFYLAKTLEIKGKTDEAKQHYKRAGELNARYAQGKGAVHHLFKMSIK